MAVNMLNVQKLENAKKQQVDIEEMINKALASVTGDNQPAWDSWKKALEEAQAQAKNFMPQENNLPWIRPHYEPYHPGVCPDCGRCPTCGRGGHWPQYHQPIIWMHTPTTPLDGTYIGTTYIGTSGGSIPSAN